MSIIQRLTPGFAKEFYGPTIIVEDVGKVVNPSKQRLLARFGKFKLNLTEARYQAWENRVKLQHIGSNVYFRPIKYLNIGVHTCPHLHIAAG